MKGIQDRRVPYSFVLGANITLKKGEFSLPFGFTFSEQERSFSQPFNQFGLSPSYKWVKTYLGYNSLNWNTYTLGGAQFLGAGVELNPKKLRVGFLYGRFRRATPVDSIGYIQNRDGLPSYKRNGWAARIGRGKEDKFIDFIIFKGKDKVDDQSPLFKDSLTYVFPSENTAFGIRTLVPITKNIRFRFDGGISLVSRDITAPLIDTSGESSGLSFLNGIHHVRYSTSSYFGGDAGLQFNIKGHSFGLNSKYVLPDYQSMGIYYIDNDVFSYGFTHAFSFWKSRVNLNYGLNRLNDNLLNRKMVTTIRLQPVVSFTFSPGSHWGVTGNWNNFYTRQEDGTIALSDSFRMNQSNPGLSLTPYGNWGDSTVYHSFFLIYTKMQLVDNNPYTAAYSQYTATIYGANYVHNLLLQNLSFSGGFNYTRNQNSLLDEKAIGINLGTSKSGNESKWTAGANLSFQFSNLSNNISFNLSGVYALKHKQAVDFGLTFLNSRTKQANTSNFNELTFMVTYRKNFNYVHKKKP